MDKIQLIQDHVYEILIEFDRICKKYNLKYSLEGGTLLGAVKYGAFVPWDDDIDVIMLRKDYDCFLKIAPSELSSKFFVQSQKNIPDFPLNYAKLCMNDTRILDYAYSHIKDMHHGLFIDIFPIDNCLTSKAKIQRSVVGILTSSRSKKLKLECGSGWKMVVRSAIAWLPLRFLNAAIYFFCTLFNGINTKYRYEICNSTERFNPLEARIYDKYTVKKFNGKEYPVVAEYDYFLQNRFGKNYMITLPPEKDRKISHFHKIEIKGVIYEE
jgi:lipopolysaccharide cholinephosphotransferase